MKGKIKRGGKGEGIGMERKEGIDPEGFWGDMKINNPCLLKIRDYLLFSVASVPTTEKFFNNQTFFSKESLMLEERII